MKNLPEVTVILINHNYDQWVDKAIMSVVYQDYPKLRLSIVDDGSTDNSIANIMSCMVDTQYSIENLEKKPIETFTHKNNIPTTIFRYAKAGGPSRARNTAMKIAWSHSDIFSMLDSDDEFKPEKISKSILKFIEHTQLGATYSDYDIISPDTGLTRREYKEPFSIDRLCQEMICHSAITVRKDVINDIGGYSEDYRTAEDWGLYLRIAKKYLISHIAESMMYVKNHSLNSTNTVDKNIWNANWQKISLLIRELYG